MKEYIVYVDITYSVSVCVNAKNEYEAKELAEMKVGNDPNYWVKEGAIANINAYDYDVENAK